MISAPVIITPPIELPIDLEAVKLFLRVDGDDLDDEITLYIRAAIADIERITGTFLAVQTIRVQVDRFSDLSHLTFGPVTAIDSISYAAPDGSPVAIDVSAFTLTGLGLARSVVPIGQWPTVPRGRPIAVDFDVGYPPGNLPANIDLALKMWVRSKFDGTPFDLFEATVNDRIWL